jgi:hypothetical protein
MTGAIWLAQLSQYPLLAYVGTKNFITYESEHIRRISKIAWFILYVELATGALLLFYTPGTIPRFIPIIGFILISIIWVTTWFIQYPLHKKLAHGFDKEFHRKLVESNWIRTIAWTGRAILWTMAFHLLLH